MLSTLANPTTVLVWFVLVVRRWYPLLQGPWTLQYRAKTHCVGNRGDSVAVLEGVREGDVVGGTEERRKNSKNKKNRTLHNGGPNYVIMLGKRDQLNHHGDFDYASTSRNDTCERAGGHAYRNLGDGA
jgi:hypothetical protein